MIEIVFLILGLLCGGYILHVYHQHDRAELHVEDMTQSSPYICFSCSRGVRVERLEESDRGIKTHAYCECIDERFEEGDELPDNWRFVHPPLGTPKWPVN